MLRGALQDRSADGHCQACGEPFPYSTGIAIYEAVKRDLEHLTPPHEPVYSEHADPNLRWEELEDREYRCPGCLH